MILVDVNVLVYAVDTSSAKHEQAREWWEARLSSNEAIGLPWMVILGFLRITTSFQIMPHPLSMSEAVRRVTNWLAQPQVRVVEPARNHWNCLQRRLSEIGIGANRTMDAHLAALADELGCEVCSTDTDFARFSDLKWRNPLETPA